MHKILVVDDDADTRCNIADLFEDCGYSVDSAEDGESALKQAQRHVYDVGLLDLRMPGMDGVALCRRLKQLRPGMVTLVVTGYASDGLDDEARAAGACKVFHKPVDFAKLLEIVEQALPCTN
jgi:CheY-like chemotaxis protein